MNLKPQYIEATGIPDAWFQCVYRLLDEGNRYKDYIYMVTQKN